MSEWKRHSYGIHIGCYNNFVGCMKKLLSILLHPLMGLLILTACSTATPVAITTSPQPTATQVKILPTPTSPNDSITYQNLHVTMLQNEITTDFITEFGSTRIPSPGMKFLWVHVQLENMGQDQIDLPLPEHFSVLYAVTELKPTYGHRMDHTDYTVLDPILFSNKAVDAWLRFDIPDTAELKNLQFVFIPESSQIGASFSSPNYPYSEDHPTFVWKCAPQ